MPRNGDEVFLDVGCYDGYTSLEFAKKYPNYRQIIAFEPDPDNFVKCVENLSDLKNVKVLNFGASSSKSVLNISKGGSQSNITSEGLCKINVDTIDNLCFDMGIVEKVNEVLQQFSAEV